MFHQPHLFAMKRNLELSSLPEDCLNAILDHIPLCDLLSNVSLVSKLFYNLHNEAFLRKRHLLLVFGRDELSKVMVKSENVYSQCDAIPISRYDLEQRCIILKYPMFLHWQTKRFLTKLKSLSQLTSLHIVILAEPPVDAIRYLTAILSFKWSTHLETFKLSFAYTPSKYDQSNLIKVYEIILI